MLSNQRLDVFFEDGFYYVRNKTSSSLSVIIYKNDDVFYNEPVPVVAYANSTKKIILDFDESDSYYIFVDNNMVALVKPELLQELIDYIVYDIACDCPKDDDSKCSKCKEDKDKKDCEKLSYFNALYKYFFSITFLDGYIQTYFNKLNLFFLDNNRDFKKKLKKAKESLSLNGSYLDFTDQIKDEYYFFYTFMKEIYSNDFDFHEESYDRCMYDKGSIDIFIFENVSISPKKCLTLYSDIDEAYLDMNLDVGDEFVTETEVDNTNYPVFVKVNSPNNSTYLGPYPFYDNIQDALDDPNLKVLDKYCLNGSDQGQIGELYIKLNQTGSTQQYYYGCLQVYDSESDALSSDYLDFCDTWVKSSTGKVYLKSIN